MILILIRLFCSEVLRIHFGNVLALLESFLLHDFIVVEHKYSISYAEDTRGKWTAVDSGVTGAWDCVWLEKVHCRQVSLHCSQRSISKKKAETEVTCFL